jgi:hypothetical protein
MPEKLTVESSAKHGCYVIQLLPEGEFLTLSKGYESILCVFSKCATAIALGTLWLPDQQRSQIVGTDTLDGHLTVIAGPNWFAPFVEELGSPSSPLDFLRKISNEYSRVAIDPLPPQMVKASTSARLPTLVWRNDLILHLELGGDLASFEE